MPKQIQIDEKLFFDLYKLIVLECSDVESYNSIKQQLENKFNRVLNHALYSKYKTADTQEEREKARQEYLDSIELSKNFRWSADCEQ